MNNPEKSKSHKVLWTAIIAAGATASTAALVAYFHTKSGKKVLKELKIKERESIENLKQHLQAPSLPADRDQVKKQLEEMTHWKEQFLPDKLKFWNKPRIWHPEQKMQILDRTVCDEYDRLSPLRGFELPADVEIPLEGELKILTRQNPKVPRALDTYGILHLTKKELRLIDQFPQEMTPGIKVTGRYAYLLLKREIYRYPHENLLMRKVSDEIIKTVSYGYFIDESPTPQEV